MNESSFKLNRRQLLAAVSLCAGGSWARSAAVDGWPKQALKIVVPAGPGGSADFIARTFGNFVEKKLGQTVLIENIAGANGVIAVSAVKRAPADGHTFLIITSATHGANGALFKKLPYDPKADFAAVGNFGYFGTLCLVRHDGPIQSFADLLDKARARPAKLSYGYSSTISQVPMEMLKAKARLDLVGVSYKTITQALTDLIGAQFDVMFCDTLSAAPALQNPAVKAIAVSTEKRLASLPHVPTVAEFVPGYQIQGWEGLGARAGTPQPVLQAMNGLVRSALADAELTQAWVQRGLIADQPKDLKQMAAMIDHELATWREWLSISQIEA